MAKPTEPKQEDPLADRLSVEELLLFDEGDAAERSVSSQTAKQQIRSTSASTEEHVRGTAPASPKNHSTVRSALPEGSSVSAASAAAASFTLRSEEVNETDDEADVYGIAGSAASVERHLMEDLLQQASFNSTNEAENDVEDNEEGGEAAETGNDEALQNIFIHHTNSSYRRGSEPASPHTTSSVNGSDAAPSSNPAVSAEHTNQKDGAAIEDSEGSAPFVTAHVSEAVDVSPSGTDAAEDAVQLAEESNEEDESMDTVLEEETDRMLQAALTNMMKESAANAAVTPTASRPQMSGSGGYVFFSKEAVMAAEELLAASEQSAADAARTSGSQRMGPAAAAAAAAAETNGVEADFDDDAVRAAEMESLGLNMETSKR
ncbi:hypothetical protein ABB37_04449 [Leptomonas pyrrhocoris]|uniref:Uncharacterized protein n=1 Tax=Leptomonas pyrrhocoris TaxID=157538 RepID=A0A0N0DW02_LEPPY|nr:hypothetical protein ABB37_04449 [Leptomonas pyrrhocoris]KPA81091.1 hypothetical protein ABB37_04449 [Leptomonas pyrrhocoris]|eukprot:XP_015659530.1 hypothetical protein ABB37_04449 [Leptomonas pyrrhocoris]